MKGVIINHAADGKERYGFKSLLINYVLIPFRSGIFGLISFLAVLIAAKYLGFLFGSVDIFKLELEDLYLSLIGFGLVFLIKFLENYGKLHPESNKESI